MLTKDDLIEFGLALQTRLMAHIDMRFAEQEIRLTKMMDIKIEELAIMINSQFALIDKRFDRIESKLDIHAAQLSNHELRIITLES